MDLSSFYSLMAVTCFTLVGLWWTVIERHPQWKADPTRRRLAGGVYLSFLLPGLMSTFAQVDAGNPLIWRSSFTIAAIVGVVNTVQLLGADGGPGRGPFRRFRWVVAVIYAVIAVLGVFPAVSSLVGLTALQSAAIALILLMVLAHGLTWEFMMKRERSTEESPESP